MNPERQKALLAWWGGMSPEQQQYAMLQQFELTDRLTVELMAARNNVPRAEQLPGPRDAAGERIPPFPKIEGVDLGQELQLLHWWAMIHDSPQLKAKALQFVAMLIVDRDKDKRQIVELRKEISELHAWIAHSIETITGLEDRLMDVTAVTPTLR